MMQKLTKFFNLIKENKQTRILSIMTIALLFIFTIGYSLSVFTGGSNKKVANIKVNDLSFNMTTNSGESDDRILHLQAGKTEQFNIVLTNLNKVDVKYELMYELCNNQDCTSTSKEIPSDLKVYDGNLNVNGSLKIDKSNNLRIITSNNSSNDYYIKLNLNAGYGWNELELANQIYEKNGISKIKNIISYVDGIKVESETPNNCGYTAKAKAKKNGEIVETEDIEITCDYYNNKWSINFKDLMELPDQIELYFTSVGIPADALIKEFDYIAPTTSYPEPYHIYEIPANGKYKLEIWGAQGGTYNSRYIGGYGGYSTGIISLSKGDKIYLTIGGTGSFSLGLTDSASRISGGYNGGGSGTTGGDGTVYLSGGGSGGGATHVSTVNGVLSTFSSTSNLVLMVAGGGGGAAVDSYNNYQFSYKGGSGGGASGVRVSGQTAACAAGSQTGGNSFGRGGNASVIHGASGGGGGYYGGSSGGTNSPGCGGSGYIGNSFLTNKYMYCYGCDQSTEESTYTLNTLGTSNLLDKTNCPNGYSSSPVSKCAKAGNGYARITFVNDAN